MLRTRAPLSWGASSPIPSDLHVLGLPLAFFLSQDQTLHCIMSQFDFSDSISSKFYLFKIESVIWWMVSRQLGILLFTIDHCPFTVFFLQFPILFLLVIITIPSSTVTLHDLSLKNLSPSPSRLRLICYRPRRWTFNFNPGNRFRYFRFSTSRLFWDCKGTNLFGSRKFYFFNFREGFLKAVPSFAGCKGTHIFRLCKSSLKNNESVCLTLCKWGQKSL